MLFHHYVYCSYCITVFRLQFDYLQNMSWPHIGFKQLWLLSEKVVGKVWFIHVSSCLIHWPSPLLARCRTRRYVTTDERGVSYHLNLCGEADQCDDGVSICEEQGQRKTSIASFKNQTIMADGESSICSFRWNQVSEVSGVHVDGVSEVGSFFYPTSFSQKLYLLGVYVMYICIRGVLFYYHCREAYKDMNVDLCFVDFKISL